MEVSLSLWEMPNCGGTLSLGRVPIPFRSVNAKAVYIFLFYGRCFSAMVYKAPYSSRRKG